MEFRGKKLYILMAATFVIVFLMNYLGNSDADAWQSALMNGAAGAIGLGIGLWFLGRSKPGKDDHHEFD